MVVSGLQRFSVSPFVAWSRIAYTFRTILPGVSFPRTGQANSCILWLVWGRLLYPGMECIFCFIGSRSFFGITPRSPLKIRPFLTVSTSLWFRYGRANVGNEDLSSGQPLRITFVRSYSDSSVRVFCLNSSNLESEIGTQLAMLTNLNSLSSETGLLGRYALERRTARNIFLPWS